MDTHSPLPPLGPEGTAIMAKITAEMDLHKRLFDAAAAAYVALLTLPPDERAKWQRELAALRDAIAESSGLDAEYVQVSAETIARMVGQVK